MIALGSDVVDTKKKIKMQEQYTVDVGCYSHICTSIILPHDNNLDFL
jgi:hypothetical protein